MGLFAAKGSIRAEPRLPQGKIATPKSIYFIKETREVLATLGTSFGLEFVVSSRWWHPFTRVKVVMTNPPITNPTTGETYSRSGFFAELPNGQVQPIVYSFHEPWEIALGGWSMNVYYNEKLLVSEKFNVVAP